MQYIATEMRASVAVYALCVTLLGV